MNQIRRICRSLSGRHGRAGLLLASAAPAVLVADPPLPYRWNKNPPLPTHAHQLPTHVHQLATGGTPGWQLTLMALTVILLAATLVAIGYPGARHLAGGAHTRRLSDGHNHGRANPQVQPPGERPPPASQPGRNGFAKRFAQDIAPAMTVAAGQSRPAPATTTRRWRMMTAARLRPRTVQLCIHCRQTPAGFWVSHTSDQTARRPWCLSCCQGLDQSRHHLIPFDAHDSAGRSQ